MHRIPVLVYQSRLTDAIIAIFGLLSYEHPSEPTEHFLNELYDAYERLSAVCRVVIVLPSSGSSSPAYARFADKYGRIDTYIDADEVQEPLARAAFKEPGDYPLLFLMGGYPDCRFASAGYSVGSVELIIKLAALI